MSKEGLMKLTVWLGTLVVVGLLIIAGWFAYAQLGAEPVLGKGVEITHVTGGVIAADTLIAVRFSEPQVSEDSVGKRLAKNPFLFSPHISGYAFWEDVHTLVFQPAKPLYRKEDYKASLNFGGEEKIKFNFSSLGQEITDFTGQFLPVADGAVGDVFFTGTITFSEKVPDQVFKEHLQLKLAGKNLDFQVATSDNLTFQLKSEQFQRYQAEPRTLYVLVSGEPFGLGDDLLEEYRLSSFDSPLEVVNVVEEKVGEFSRLRIAFSDLLASDRDYRGYINIQPQVDFTVQVQGSELLISGQFRPGEQYSIEFFQGLASAHGKKLNDAHDLFWEVEISDLKPVVEFIDEGMLLTTAARKRIAFRTMNVNRLNLQVKKVAEANLLAFYEENSYRPGSNSFYDYNRYRFLRLGEVIEDRVIDVSTLRNSWVRSEIDLSNVLNDEDGALYIIQLDFAETQAAYFPENMDRWDISDHVYLRGQAVKHIIISDLGLTAKEMQGDLHAFVTNLLTTEPVGGALVILKNKEGSVLDSAYSDKDGAAKLEAHQDGRYLEVHAGGMSALMNLPSSRLNTALFDIGGVQKQDGVDAFIYTERGVYRPGDEINITAILRNEDQTFPDNHPVSIRIYNPQDRLIHEETVTKARDGFYSFSFTTESNAPTGNWRALLHVGGRIFPHDLKIEEIVPYRIRVEADGPAQLTSSEREVELLLRSEYLFGAPAAGLESESTLYLEAYEKTFPAYSQFVFGNETVGFLAQEANFSMKLDERGEAYLAWELPTIKGVPSALRLRLESKVYESGGRSVPYAKTIPLEHYSSFVGIMQLDDPDLRIGQQADFRIVHLDSKGEPLAGSELEYTIYRLRRSWWWEYDRQADFRRYFKQNEQLIKAGEGTLTTDDNGFAQVQYAPEDSGEVILEVKDPVGGHSAAYFFRSYRWGQGAESSTPAAIALKLDEESYQPGDTARVTISAPVGSRALLTVEKEGKLLEQRWHQIYEAETSLAVQITEEYLPNAYLSLLVIQPSEEKNNDLPLRMYGIAPLNVVSKATKIKLQLDLPATIKPEEKFTLKIQTEDHEPAQLTVAVVDEGLLNITGFATPDPHGHFFAKQRLLTKNYDNFSDVIEQSFGYIQNVFTVGGGEELDYQKMQAPDQDALRFEAVSLFRGPFATDETGYAEIEFELPNYIGSVRVMVIAASGGRYGKAEQDLPVKAPLMVLPTLPRVLRPEDEIVVPVTVFALEDGLGQVQVAIEATGPVQVQGPAIQMLTFDQAETAEVFFELVADAEVGTGEILISAVAVDSGDRSSDGTSLPIRAANPYIYLSETRIANEGETVSFIIPPAGVAGTEWVQFSISPWRGLNLDHRLQWLIRYPYFCLEQITSAAFPQLYLPGLVQLNQKQLKETDENINAAIHALWEYQLSSGGFAYWPGGGAADLWSTNYAGHFLLEARAKGYHVPSELLDGWLKFQKEAARSNAGSRQVRAYRLYLLALAQSPELSAINYMRESELDQLNGVSKHLLAAAHHILGYTATAQKIAADGLLDVDEGLEWESSFGSPLRDVAMLLETLLVLGEYEQAAPLYELLAKELSSNHWYSTQTTAYGLLAISKYIKTMSEQIPLLTGELTVGGKQLQIKEKGTAAVVPLVAQGGQTVHFTNTMATPLFATLTWEGIPQPQDLEPQQSKLKLKVDYYDGEGHKLDVTRLVQGTEFYAVFSVGQEQHEDLSELALVHVLPAGWEIENLRLLDGRLPEWTEEYYLGQEDYLDLRDDRIMWFFDLYGWQDVYHFVVKLNAVTVGTFQLPPVLLEAMYDNDYKVVTESGIVEVLAR